MTCNLWRKFEETASKHTDKIAIGHKKDEKWTRISYGKLRNNTKYLSFFLSEKNIKKNDRVAIIFENRPEWPLVFFGVVSRGAVAVPINTDSTRGEVENILKDSGSKLIFASESTSGLVEGIRESCPSVEEVISVDSDLFADAIKEPSGESEVEQSGKGDLACILYTSGTTDEPKGVMLTHGNLLANCDSMLRLNIIKSSDNIAAVLPLHHAYPLMGTMLLPLLYGFEIVFPGTMRGEELLAAMREAKATAIFAVPQIFYAFHQRITEALGRIPFPFDLLLKFTANFLYKIRKATGINLSRYLFYGVHRKFGRSMRLFVSGGAKLDEDVEDDMLRFGFAILEGYGLTETSPVLTFNPSAKPKIGSAGVPVPSVELKIVDENEEGIGEVVVCGPNIMKGYYKKPDETAEVIKDGWFHTGDLGYIDEEGYLFLTGRLKEVIVLSSGKNIYPDEIEKAYSAEAPVKEMCVFEMTAKERMREDSMLWAVVVPDIEYFRKYGAINLKAIIKERFDNVSRTLPPYKRLMGFSITLDELPRTLLGKIKRFVVGQTYTARVIEEGYFSDLKELSEEDKGLMETPTGGKIIKYLKEQTGIDRVITPGFLLELDLGIDSLGRIELAEGLEALLGIEIEDQIIGKAFTVRDLIVGIGPLMSGVEAPIVEGGMTFSREEWNRILRVPPEKKQLDKIDLAPGFGAWMAGFLFMCVIKAFFKIFYRLKVEGEENLPDKGPYIIYANHTSYYDGLIAASSLPKFPRLDLFFVGFRVYFDVPIIRNLIRIGRIIPLDFSAHFLEALRSCYYVLDNGKTLFLFPEGLRTLDGRVGQFQKGFGILAKETNAKLVPLLIGGAYQAWPRTSKFPKLHRIRAIIGKPMDIGHLEKEGLEMGAGDRYTAICLSARNTLAEMQKNNDIIKRGKDETLS